MPVGKRVFGVELELVDLEIRQMLDQFEQTSGAWEPGRARCPALRLAAGNQGNRE